MKKNVKISVKILFCKTISLEFTIKKETRILASPNSISNAVILLSNYIRIVAIGLHFSKLS